MKKGFSITSRLNDQSKTDRMKAQEACRVEHLPLDRIVPSRDNPYRLCEIEKLAESIETVGLLTPVTVQEANERGEYELISGNRRLAACRLLLEEGHQDVAIIPALIAKAGGDAYSRLQLLQANSTARELTTAEKVMQVSEMKAALVRMKAENHPSLAGKRVRERLAELLEVSPAQVGIMEQIDKGLAPGLKDAMQAGDMGLVQARELSRMLEAKQEEVLEAYRSEGKQAIRSATRKPRQERQPTQPPALPSAARQAAEELRAIALDIEMGAALEDERIWAACLAAADLLERRGH